MERIKISKYNLFPLIISIILSMIPFFWFKPGEMDLGGDSGRLYFYDPVSYFFTNTLYTISSSSVGGPTLNYANIPFIYLLIALKYIFTSPTILISGLYGISLSLGFIFCYLTIMELTESKNNFYAAIAGALAYVFFPALIDTWRHTLLTFNQVFLNPFIFYLLLKYFKTSRISILFVIVLITFIFSTNFSFFAAPGVFAFYPISVLFLVLYAKIILKKTINLKHILLSLLLFLGIQAFHLIPLISSIFSFGNNANTTIFSDVGKFNRGLSYFSSIAPNIKASINLLGLPQMESLNFFSNAFIIFPFIIVTSFLFNKKKTILLTLFFFLVVLFFATANITDTWLSIYKWLFNVPGFSMFRNFFGQWVYAYMFFYSILFGQAFYVVFNALHYSQSRLKKLLTFLLISVPILILVINATPLIKGDIVRQLIWQSNNVRWVLKIDPDYEQALSFVRSLPAEGRVLTLPLTDYGYQIIAGENGGAYLGPSAISYLAGKKDFSGYNELLGYEDLMLNLIKKGELETFKRILGVINVKYVFYDADPIVYDQFPSFPYRHTSWLPQDQHEYKEFINSLNLPEIKNINNKFFVYEIPNDYYLPQVSVAKKSLTFNEPIAEIQTPLSLITKDNRIAINTNEENTINRVSVSEIKFDEILTDLRTQSPFWNVIKSTNKSDYDFPYTSWGMNSLIYPIIVQRENQQLANYKELDRDIDRRIFFAEKRIAELQKWGKEALILGSVKSIKEFDSLWTEPNLWDAIFFKKYNYWEVSLLRYSTIMNELIDKIEKASVYDNALESKKDKIRRVIGADKDMLYRAIQSDEKLSLDQKIYVAKLAIDMFDSLSSRIQFHLPSFQRITYNLGKLEQGNYNIDIDKNLIRDYDESNLSIVINNQMLRLNRLQQDANWFKMQNVFLKENGQSSFSLLLNKPTNLILRTAWESVEKGNPSLDSVSWTISDIAKEKNGILREIGNWEEKSYYSLSFDYKTFGKGFKIVIFDKTEGKNQRVTNLVEDILRSNDWKTYTALIASSDDAKSSFIQIHKVVNNDLLNQVERTQDQTTEIDIRNLSIVKIPNPKIVLRRVNTTNDQDKKIPQITFTRINPTKYQLEVKNATSPYTLVLVNQFNEKWKLVDPTQNTPTIKAFFSRFLANIGKIGVSILGKENGIDKNTILTYFGGDVRENVNNDIFLNEKTFETWGKDEIGQYKHFPVNGFANAWYIEPSDMRNKTDYNLIIEMSSQKLLYAGLIISISTVIFTLLLLVKFLKK